MAFGIARKTYHQGDRLSASDFNRVSRAARKASLYTTSQGGVQGLESTGTITYAVSKLSTSASTGAVCSLVGIDGRSLYLAKAEEPPFCILLHTAQPNDLVTVATSGGPWLTIVDGGSESIERGDLLSPTEAGLVTKEDGTDFYAVEDEYTSDGIRFVRVTFAAGGDQARRLSLNGGLAADSIDIPSTAKIGSVELTTDANGVPVINFTTECYEV